MDEQRKEIIIREIKYWKDSHLLPEHYCDFLLTLYTKGAGEEETKKSNKSLSFKGLFNYFVIYFIAILFPITFLVIYFTEMSILMQILLFTIFVIITIVATFVWYKKKSPLYHLSIVKGAVILLLTSIHLTGTLLTLNILVLLVMLINCILWILIGLKLKINYLLYSGGIGVFILMIYYFL